VPGAPIKAAARLAEHLTGGADMATVANPVTASTRSDAEALRESQDLREYLESEKRLRKVIAALRQRATRMENGLEDLRAWMDLPRAYASRGTREDRRRTDA
jgi:hypothetical protein